MKYKYSIDLNDLLNFNNYCHTYIVDLDNRLLDCNHAQFQAIQQLTKIGCYEKIIGMDIKEVFSPEDFRIISKENLAVIDAKKTMAFYNTWTIPNLKKGSYITIKTPVYDDLGDIKGIFGISYFLSEHRTGKSVAVNLSDRETDCIIHLLRGKTAKGIAKILGLALF